MSNVEQLLSPVVDAFDKLFQEADYDKMATYYHEDCVLVTKGKEAKYGRDAIMESLKGLIAAAGKFEENKMFDKKFEGDVNFIVYTGKFESKTEKLGAMKGNFLQIWRKVGDSYQLYHDEIEVTEGKF